MALAEYISLDNNDIIGIWKMTESVEDLLILLQPKEAVLNQYNTITNSKRQHEFLTAHLLIKELTGQCMLIHKDETGKPYLPHSPFNISVSHSSDYCAVLLSEHYVCGLDIERIKPSIKQVAAKFVSEYEDLYVPQTAYSQYYTVIWSMKEAIYKWYAKKGLNFKENMVIHPFKLEKEGGPVYYEFVKNGQKCTRIGQYRFFDQHIIAWVLDDAFTLSESE